MLNRAGHELLGYRDGELVGADWFPRFVPGGADMLEPYARMLAEGAIPADQEFPLLRRDGSEVLISWKMKVLPDCAGLGLTTGNRLLLKSASPTVAQVKLWDRWCIPFSRRVDPLLGHRLGKSILAVWRRGAA